MPSRVKAIGPDDCAPLKSETLPDAVLASFNEVIAANFDGEFSTFKQEAVIQRIMQRMDMAPNERGKIFEHKWLDVELVYRLAGWEVDVEYANIDRGNTGGAFFRFHRKPKEE